LLEQKKMKGVMKYIATVSLAMICASPAFADASRSGSLIGSIVVSATTAVSALNVNVLNDVSVLSGNKTNVSAVTPITLKNNSILNGVLGFSHGCGCN